MDLNRPAHSFFPIGVAVLLTACLLFIAENSYKNWIVCISVGSAFLFTCLSQEVLDLLGYSFGKIAIFALAFIIALLFLSQPQLIAIYVSGGCFLITLFLSSRFHDSKEGKRNREILIISIMIIVALVFSPVTVSRIVVYLADLPVPSKLELHNDPQSSLQHYAEKTLPYHVLQPLRIRLNAGNIAASSPMPWLRFKAQRASHFIINRITYEFLSVRLHQLFSKELHQLRLADRSDEVTLVQLHNGIRILDITSEESAWIKLPNIDSSALTISIILQVTLIKVAIWMLIAFGFIYLSPKRRVSGI